MKHNKVLCIIAVAVLLLFVLCPNASAAQASGGASPTYSMLVLEPGHSQTLLFELGTTVFNNPKAVYACYVLTVGTGTLNVRVGTASSVGAYSSVVYTTPVFKYAYNAETISYSAEVPAFGIGIFFAAIVRDTGSPDYPIVMSMVVSLLE
jgi:hypothetical protein